MGTNLKSLRFAAFALGNKQYQHYCAMGKWVDAKVSAHTLARHFLDTS